MWKISESDPVLLKIGIIVHKNSVKNGIWLEKDRKKIDKKSTENVGPRYLHVEQCDLGKLKNI